MSLRKRACTSCVAAKRKCDLAFPTCHRCTQRSLACRYPYPPLTVSRGDQLDEGGLGPGGYTNDIATAVHHSEGAAPPVDSDTATRLDDASCHLRALVDEICISPTVETNPEYAEHTPWPVSFDRRILEFYPRVEDHATWRFCVTTLLTQVDAFLRVGSAFFIDTPAHSTGNLPPPLQVAYGVCASYKLRKESPFLFYQQLLANEVESLLAAQSPSLLQDQLAELSAILLYYIIIIFGSTSVPASLAERTESLLAQRTAHVESLELATRKSTDTLVETGLVSADEALDWWRLCDGARRVVVVSYLAREIHHVLRWKTCYLLRQIVALPVSKPYVSLPASRDSLRQRTSSQWREVVTYDQFVRDWEAGQLGVADEFTYLLVSACKGIGTM